MERIAQFFKFKELNTDLKTELMAGVTTFATLAYIMVVNPNILSAAGMPFGATMAATIYMAFIGCMLMGLYANRPFAVAPLLAENAFLVSTVVLQFGYSWQQAFGAVAISAITLFLLTVFNIRAWLVNSLPACIKFAFTAGLGLYLAFIGLSGAKIVTVSQNSSLAIGNLTDVNVLLTIFGVLIIAVLMSKGVKVAMLAGLVIVTILSILLGQTSLPETIFSTPPSLEPILFKADMAGVLNVQSIPVIFVVFVLMFVDTMGTMIGVSAKAGFLDKNGNLPNIKRAMLCDSSATVISSSMSAITSGVYVESTTGVMAGGCSGLTAVVVGILFLLGLFFSPVFSIIPSSACNAVLIVIGMLMLAVIKEVNFEDLTDGFPAAVIIFLMTFSGNIGIAVAAGFVLYPILKLATGKKDALNLPIWILFAASLIFFGLYNF